MPDPRPDTFEPSVLAAAWRYKWLVLLFGILFGGLAWLFSVGTRGFTATASLAVQDPRTSIVFQQDLKSSPERYVADQAEIARSRDVATKAMEALLNGGVPVPSDVEEFAKGVTVSSSATSDLITITYTSPQGAVAIAATNAVVDAYLDESRAGADASFGEAIDELDQKIADLGSQLTSLTANIDDVKAEETAREQIQTQLAAALDELLTFPTPPTTATEAEINLSNTRLGELQARVNTLRSAADSFTPNEQIAELTRQRDEVRSRLAALQLRHDQLTVDAELAGSGVVFVARAEKAEPTSPVILTVLGAMGGLMAGAGLARTTARRRQRFTTREEPQLVLQTQLIADVPDFADERLPSLLPVVDRAESAAAEAFRFVVAGIRLAQNTASGSGPDFRVVVVTSGSLSEGKTVVTANTAMAAAHTDSRVALIDADFRNQALTTLVAPTAGEHPGLTNVAQGTATLAEAAIEVPASGGDSVTLFSQGTANVPTQDFFASTETSRLISRIAAEYDLVLVDAPPLLRLAYSGTVVRLAERVLTVVPHGGDVTLAEEMRRQLRTIGVPVLGYVYNRAPLRREMVVSYAATKNGPTATAQNRRSEQITSNRDGGSAG